MKKLVCESLFEDRIKHLTLVLQNIFYDWKSLGYIPSLLTYSDEFPYELLILLKKTKCYYSCRIRKGEGD
jgi:hypothetical protein